MALVIFILGIPTIDCSAESTKQKSHGVGYQTKWEQIEVGDEEGHIIGISLIKQFYFNETNGEKLPSTSIGLIDMKLKTGEGTGHGYGVTTDKDGDKRIRSWEGKTVGKGHWQGTYTYLMLAISKKKESFKIG